MDEHHPTQHEAEVFSEFEKDLQTYLERLDRWVDLSPYERYLGRFRKLLGQAFETFSLTEETDARYRRAAVARIGIVLAFLATAMLAPMFYDYLPIAGLYCIANIVGLLIVYFRASYKSVFLAFTILDILVVTFTIHLFGSLTSVVVVFYPLLVTLATIFLNFFWGLLYAALCSGSYLLVVTLEIFGVIPYSPLLGHELPLYPVHGIPTFPIVVIVVAHMINYASVFCVGLLTYELEMRRRAARSAVQTKNEMLAVCSHDLKNILVAISGYSELLTMDSTGAPDDVRHHAQEISQSSRRMLELIRNLLDAARIEGGKVPLVRSKFTFQDLLRDVGETQLSNAGLNGVELELPASGDNPTFNADRSKIVQALTNLVQNAITYTPEQGIVTVELTSVGEDAAKIAVRDTGPGIPNELQEILFDSLALARRRKEQNQRLGQALSTGLGLSIVKSFVEMHGGRIWVESEPGSGTTFWVELPTA